MSQESDTKYIKRRVKTGLWPRDQSFGFVFEMNPITSTVAASCNRLALSPRSSPRGSPRHSPNALRKPPFLDLPDDKKRRDSKETVDYKKLLAQSTSQAYRAQRTENKKSDGNAGKRNAHAGKQKPPKRLLEEAVQAATAEEHGKKKTANVKASSSTSSASRKDKKCSIM